MKRLLKLYPRTTTVFHQVRRYSVKEDKELFTLMNKLYEDAQKPQTGISLRELMAFGKDPSPVKMLRSAQWLYKELRIRLARYFPLFKC